MPYTEAIKVEVVETMAENRKRKQAFVTQQDCVACGCCVSACPREAITIVKGMFAQVIPQRCVGCERCCKACPACVITMVEAPG